MGDNCDICKNTFGNFGPSILFIKQNNSPVEICHVCKEKISDIKNTNGLKNNTDSLNYLYKYIVEVSDKEIYDYLINLIRENQTDDKSEWFYILNGKRSGPVTTDRIKNMYADGIISYNTKVWQKGYPDWVEFRYTNLINFADTPPPLTGKDVKNTLMWILAFTPLFYAIINNSIEYYSMIIITILLNSILCIVDERKLKKAGHDTKELLVWAFILIPVYIFRRASLLKQKKSYAIVWCLFFLIYLFSSNPLPSFDTSNLNYGNFSNSSYSNSSYSTSYIVSSGATSKTTSDNNVSMTISQKNAVKRAKEYLNYSAFSYKGLITQLEFEKYSNQDAVYAVNNCGANWNEQATKKAKTYIEASAFSHEGLIDQLKYENYSDSQAEYGANNCGVNWNEQATKKAKTYIEISAFSYEGLIDQLKYEKYTESQAEYGVKNCGANWNEQAKKKAKTYIELSAFSRDSLISQLEYEKFTHEQAVYGAEQNGY
jgi:hypothetical protein